MRTSKRRRSLTAGLAAGTAGVVMAGLGLTTAPTASADVTSSYLLPQTNVFKADGTENLYTSDPFVMRCQDRDYTHGYCLYTSQDLGVVSGTGNSFQMHDTLGFFSTTGRPGTWQARGKVFDEDRIPWVPADANHQWAPGAFQTVGKGGNYTALLIPNVTNPSTPDPNNPSSPPMPGKPITPAWYRDAQSSPMKESVESGSNEIDLALTSTPPPGWKPPPGRR